MDTATKQTITKVSKNLFYKISIYQINNKF